MQLKIKLKNTIEELKSILINDILKSIKVNLECGNIESGDAYRLKECTVILYRYLYSKYTEMEAGVTESNIRSTIEILSSAGFGKNEITDMIAEKFKVDKAYVEKLFN